jgi:hypothetical protein
MIGSSQIINHGSQSATQAIVCGTRIGEAGSKPVTTEEPDDLDSEDDDYVPHSDDSGEDDEAMELRKFAKEYKKKLRDSEMFVERDASGTVPIDLVANVEEVVEQQNIEHEFDSGSEDFSYDDATDEEGHIVRRKSRFVRYNPKSEVPHFSLGMVFRSKNDMRKALTKYGLVTYRSILFMKSEEDRVRAKCGWPGCPWLIYGAKTSRCSRFQVITYESEHHCAPNRDNKLVTAKVIAKRYEHFILANPTWKIDSIKSTVLKDFFCRCVYIKM